MTTVAALTARLAKLEARPPAHVVRVSLPTPDARAMRGILAVLIVAGSFSAKAATPQAKQMRTWLLSRGLDPAELEGMRYDPPRRD